MDSNPYKSPQFEVALPAVKTRDFLVPTGLRVGRLRFLALKVLNFSLFIMLASLSSIHPENGYLEILFGLYVLAVFIPAPILLACFRAMDIGLRWYWGLMNLVPIIGSFYGLWLLFQPGNTAINNSGALPCEKPWRSAAIITLSIVGAAAMIYFYPKQS